MGQGKPPNKATERESSVTSRTAVTADDQTELMKMMTQTIESVTTALSEKMTTAIADLKSSLLDKDRPSGEALGQHPEDFARPEKATRQEYPRGIMTGPTYERPSLGFGFGQGPSQPKIHLERYSGLSTKTLPANWMRSYEAMASLQQWSEQYKITMLRFYLADEAIIWFDNQISLGLGTRPWYEIRERFEKYFNLDKVVTPKMVLGKEWECRLTMPDCAAALKPTIPMNGTSVAQASSTACRSMKRSQRTRLKSRRWLQYRIRKH